MNKLLKNLGPGLLFAGAAIGVSHLVQSTRAGADFGFGLAWALILIHVCKYPFFQYGPRYASATGESLLKGYNKLGKPVLIIYALLSVATMFTIQTAVTIVTAGLASSLFGDFVSLEIWTVFILALCFVVLIVGKYKLLDRVMKIIILILTLSTVAAVLLAVVGPSTPLSFVQIIPQDKLGITFLIAFMGWMPAPLDISIWHSPWTVEKQKLGKKISYKSTLYDFNVGYITTVVLGFCFMCLGTVVMYNSETSLSPNAGIFAVQLIEIYSFSLGDWAYIIIGLAALTAMLSTTITTLDASPRAFDKTLQLISVKHLKSGYKFWLVVLITGTLSIYFFYLSEMGTLIQIATVLSFLTAPFYALANYILISSKHTPKMYHPSKWLHALSIFGILFLIGFSVWYLWILCQF